NRNVQVHKLMCVGTMEERIDEMIERKNGVAAQVGGTGEAWLTELSNEQLRDLVALRPEALGERACGIPSITSRVRGRAKSRAASRRSSCAGSSDNSCA